MLKLSYCWEWPHCGGILKKDSAEGGTPSLCLGQSYDRSRLAASRQVKSGNDAEC